MKHYAYISGKLLVFAVRRNVHRDFETAEFCKASHGWVLRYSGEIMFEGMINSNFV